MVGAIVKRDILAHPLVTIRCFGLRVFLRAALARRDQTFLSLLTDTGALKPAVEAVANFIGRCVELELTASRIYSALARRFHREQAVREFFHSLSAQEEGHGQLLEICRVAATRERWDEGQAGPWREVVPQLERQMKEAEGSLDDVQTVHQSLQAVIDIESSEINNVFSAVVAASDSNFVRKLSVFHEVQRIHLGYICRTIAALDPSLVEASEALKQRCA